MIDGLQHFADLSSAEKGRQAGRVFSSLKGHVDAGAPDLAARELLDTMERVDFRPFSELAETIAVRCNSRDQPELAASVMLATFAQGTTDFRAETVNTIAGALHVARSSLSASLLSSGLESGIKGIRFDQVANLIAKQLIPKKEFKEAATLMASALRFGMPGFTPYMLQDIVAGLKMQGFPRQAAELLSVALEVHDLKAQRESYTYPLKESLASKDPEVVRSGGVLLRAMARTSAMLLKPSEIVRMAEPLSRTEPLLAAEALLGVSESIRSMRGQELNQARKSCSKVANRLADSAHSEETLVRTLKGLCPDKQSSPSRSGGRSGRFNRKR